MEAKNCNGSNKVKSQSFCVSEAYGGGVPELSEVARGGVKASSDWVMNGMNNGTDSYGVTTGFGAISFIRKIFVEENT